METYWKAVRPNGRDFYSDTVQWAPEKVKARKGRVVKHPQGAANTTLAAHYLSVSTVPTDCTGAAWPCRLLEVEPVGESWAPHPHWLPNKRAALAFRVVREVDAREVFGPQADQVLALIERAGRLTPDEADAADAAWDAAGDAAWALAGDAAGDATRDAARDAAWDAAGDAAWALAGDAAGYGYGYAARVAAWALVVRDLIPTEHYDTLTRPWRTAIGPIHPDDPELTS